MGCMQVQASNLALSPSPSICRWHPCSTCLYVSKPDDRVSELDDRCRPYLCTGWDCYLVREPCAMCAMALTHSRVRWVVFSHMDKHRGALGGSFRLQAERSLNHHFKVMHMPAAEQGFE